MINDEEMHILSALQKAVIAAVAASDMPELPIKAVMRNFQPPADNKYLELVHIPNNINNQFWDKSKTYRGIHRLLFHWEQDDAGAYPALSVISSVCAGLSKGSKFVDGELSVVISDNPDLTGLIEASPGVIFPVSLRYECFRPERIT